jgi:hypothetical protein
VFPVRRESYSYGAAFQLFVEGAEMAPTLAGPGAANARAVAFFDGNNEDELAFTRAQWKELKGLGFAVTYWQQGANGTLGNEILSQPQRRVVGRPHHISTSYVERQNLTLRMQQRRFTRLTNAFSKKLENHEAAVALYAAHYNFCRVHETLRITPAMQLDVTDHIWSIGELVDAALVVAPKEPLGTAPDRRRRFRVIEGGKP